VPEQWRGNELILGSLSIEPISKSVILKLVFAVFEAFSLPLKPCKTAFFKVAI
jgi:hypothetical protein